VRPSFIGEFPEFLCSMSSQIPGKRWWKWSGQNSGRILGEWEWRLKDDCKGTRVSVAAASAEGCNRAEMRRVLNNEHK
jgi:hypothetical protein